MFSEFPLSVDRIMGVVFGPMGPYMLCVLPDCDKAGIGIPVGCLVMKCPMKGLWT